MDSKCAGCLQVLPKREFITCMHCSNSYDLECANISSKRFYNTMTPDHKKTWKCQACRCNTPKTGNADTPIRSRDRDAMDLESSNNITSRKKPLIESNKTLSSEDLSILGDTIRLEETPINKAKCDITLQNLSEMISEQLKENNKSIILQLQNTIKTEINKAIAKLKDDVTKDINNLSLQNKEQQTEIKLINTKITNLENTNKELKREIKDLEERLTIAQTRQYSPESNSKKIVLFGLTEYYNEPETDLHNRIYDIFQDIMHVDLVGYIEATYRIGKYNNKSRPLVIELLSKKMTKYIIENSQYFQGTKLSISGFLDENARKARKIMRDEMFKARAKGLHAVIKNNELYIEGKRRSSRYIQNDTHEYTSVNNKTDNQEHANLEQGIFNVRNDKQRSHSDNYSGHYNYSFRKYNTAF